MSYHRGGVHAGRDPYNTSTCVIRSESVPPEFALPPTPSVPPPPSFPQPQAQKQLTRACAAHTPVAIGRSARSAVAPPRSRPPQAVRRPATRRAAGGEGRGREGDQVGRAPDTGLVLHVIATVGDKENMQTIIAIIIIIIHA